MRHAPLALPLALTPLMTTGACTAEVEIEEDTGGDTGEDTGGGSSSTSSCQDWDDALDEVWGEQWTALEDQVLEEVNAVRAEGYECFEGSYPPAEPLVAQEQLRCAARLHSQDMAESGIFSHTGSDGRDMQERVEAQGYTNWSALGENIAGGLSDPAATVQQWLASHEGHCGNIMSDMFTELGVGVYHAPDSPYQWYWTQDFGSSF